MDFDDTTITRSSDPRTPSITYVQAKELWLGRRAKIYTEKRQSKREQRTCTANYMIGFR
jgi:hypothetical protein